MRHHRRRRWNPAANPPETVPDPTPIASTTSSSTVLDPTVDPTPTVVAPILDGIGYAIGRHLAAPAIASALDAPDTRDAIRRTALTAGALFGACIAASIWLGRKLP